MLPALRRLAAALLAAAAGAALAPAARAEWIAFDDSGNAGVTVIANGFLDSPLVVDGSQLTDGETYTNHAVTLPKDAAITFSGTFQSTDPTSGSITLLFVGPNAPTRPFAELMLTRRALNADTEAISGIFEGYASGGLPRTTALNGTVETAWQVVTSELNAVPTYATAPFAIDGSLGIFVALDQVSDTPLRTGDVVTPALRDDVSVAEPNAAAALGAGVALLHLTRHWRRAMRFATGRRWRGMRVGGPATQTAATA